MVILDTKKRCFIGKRKSWGVPWTPPPPPFMGKFRDMISDGLPTKLEACIKKKSWVWADVRRWLTALPLRKELVRHNRAFPISIYIYSTKRSLSNIFDILSYLIVPDQCNGDGGFFLYINMLVLAWASVGLRVSVCLLPAPSHPYTTLHQSAHIACIQNKIVYHYL